jgi:capsular polysaccharide biosynthesis protein
MNSLLPTAVRAIAAALAVFMTTATLNGLISIAEPQQSQLIAQTAARQGAQVASSPRHAVTVAQALASTTSR